MTSLRFESHFSAFNRNVDHAVQAALNESLEHAAHVARELAPKRTGRMAASIHVNHASPSRRGYAGTVEGGVHYTLFEELGTRGRRTRKRKGSTTEDHRARRAALKGKGIKPHRFLSKGLRAGKQAWPDYLKRRI